MRRLAFVLSVVIGSLMLLVGGVAAALIGPDDTVSASPIEVPAAAKVAVTAPDLFPFRNTTLHLTAASTGGAVFLGTANPVDVDSYLSNVTRYHVHRLGVGGGTGSVKDGELAVPGLSPETTTFWVDSVTGAGEQSLDVPLTGDLFTIAVVPVGEPGAISFSVGVTLGGAFRAAVGVAAVGLLLVAVPLVWRRRAAAGASPGEPGHPGVREGAADPQSTSTIEEARNAAVHRAQKLSVLGFVGAVALTGCSSLPQPATLPTEPPTQVAIQLDDVPAALASYDERNNAARTLSAGSFDPSGWAAADMGPVLRSDEFDTAYRKAVGTPEASPPGTHTADAVYSPAFDAYPMWFMMVGTPTTDGVEPDPAAATGRILVFERASVVEPWRMSRAVGLPNDERPTPLPVGPASTASDAQELAAVAAMESVRNFLATGTVTTVMPDENLTAVREDFARDHDDASVGALTVTPIGSAEDPTGPDGAIRLVAVEGGALATITFDYQYNVYPSAGNTLHYTDGAFAQATGQVGERQTLSNKSVVTVAVSIPDDGPPVALNSWPFPVL
ncbi:hypothetical protein ASD16_17830 [Cellulomonas sp. Root485]|uniref:hypothetical protein n=1 Tax=Cellulomonas sp. Root485 TaxID=1736546 RepID=UPI0006F60902|nr:hypothetical protein [Cellulomonas sp. Root485]KQY21191.1 hypothetical protein ASD16_17830 [Cellulomonas sp. Root485]